MEFKKINDTTYQSEIVISSNDYGYNEKLGEIIKKIYNYPNVKINALMYKLMGRNSHDENDRKFYDIFFFDEWNDFFEQEINNPGIPMQEESPKITKHESFETFDLNKWCKFKHLRTQGLIFIEINGTPKFIMISIDWTDDLKDEDNFFLKIEIKDKNDIYKCIKEYL